MRFFSLPPLAPGKPAVSRHGDRYSSEVAQAPCTNETRENQSVRSRTTLKPKLSCAAAIAADSQFVGSLYPSLRKTHMSFISVIVASVTIAAAQDAPLLIHHLLRYPPEPARWWQLAGVDLKACSQPSSKTPSQCVSCLLSFGLPRSSQVRPISAGITHKNSHS